MHVQEFLRPGDVLLYDSGGIVGWFIRVKTWHRVVHCEGYAGGGKSVASRGPQDGQGGVGLYELRLEGLIAIMRPRQAFDLPTAMAWFKTVNKQPYDVLGLFRFFGLGWGAKKAQVCSAFLTRWQRRGGIEPFQRDEDAHNIAPFQFLISPVYEHYIILDGDEVAPSPELEAV